MKITNRGRAVALAAAALWALALATGSASATAGAALLTIALAVGLATLPKPALRIVRHMDRTRCAEGATVRETLTIETSARWGVDARIHENASRGLVPRGAPPAAVRLRRGEPLTARLEWEALTWGRKSLGPLEVEFTDGLGLLRTNLADPATTEVIVSPAARSLGKYRAPASNPEANLGGYGVSRPGDGSEFFALRPYRAGDSIRRINWKATARSTETIVNQINRENFARAVVLVDLREKENLCADVETAAVWNGRAAASILRHHEAARDHLCLIMVTDAAVVASAAPNPRLHDLVEAMSRTTVGGTARIDKAIHSNLTRIRARSPVYLCTSAALDPEIGRALGDLVALNARPTLVTRFCDMPATDDELSLISRSRDDALRHARALGVRVIDWRGASLEVGAYAA